MSEVGLPESNSGDSLDSRLERLWKENVGDLHTGLA